MQVSGLTIYPVKGGRGIDLLVSSVGAMGLAHDRQWMIVDAAGQFLTQRDTPQLAQLETALGTDGDLTLSVAGHFTTHVPIPAATGTHIPVTVWKSSLTALQASAEISENLSAWLGKTVQLVRFPPHPARHADPVWAGDNVPVGFADGYPVLIALTESLQALNERLSAPLPMSRFRTNIVITGASAWADDSWRRIRIGDVTLELVKPCTRCTVTTTDQETGAQTGKEPLATLAKIRRSAVDAVPGVFFGTNAVPRNPGEIAVGDTVQILETHTPWKIAAEKMAKSRSAPIA